MKTKDFKLLKWLCSMVMVAMGFTACSKDEPEEISVMYGTPYGEYKYEGIVTDEEGNPIQGINVTVQEYNYSINNLTVVETDKSGKFTTDYIKWGTGGRQALIFTDIDGDANGGDFEEMSFNIHSLNNKVKIEDGEGDWDNGKWKVTADVELTLKSEGGDTSDAE